MFFFIVLAPGDVAVRSSQNALKIRDCMKLHCQGNPYVNGSPLKNIVSSALIPEVLKPDVLQYPEKGQTAYEAFVTDRLMCRPHSIHLGPNEESETMNWT